MNGPWPAYACLAGAMSIAGSAVVAAKLMVARMPVFLAAELGLGAGLVFMLPLAFARGGRPALDLRTHTLLLLQALCGVVLYRVLIFRGLQHTSAAAGGLISSAAPACIAVLAYFCLREAVPRSRVLGLLCVSAGLAAVNLLPFLNGVQGPGETLKGNALVLGAVLCESVFSVLSKAACRPIPALRRTALVSAYAFCCLLPLALHDLQGYALSSLDAGSLLGVAYYGLMVSFLSYFLWFKGIARVPAGVGAAFTALVPVSGLALSWLILREPIGPAHMLGLALILVGIGFSCLPTTRLASRK